MTAVSGSEVRDYRSIRIVLIATLVMDILVCVCVMCMSMLVELFAPAWKTINTCTTLNL